MSQLKNQKKAKARNNWDNNQFKKHSGQKGNPKAWQNELRKKLKGKKPIAENLALLALEEMPKTQKELRTAYKKAMLENHPDRGGSEELAARIIEAYNEIKENL